MRRSKVGEGVARQLARAFSAVVFVVALTCIALIVCLKLADASLASVREDIASTRDALGLALAVREQYIHEAHTIIVADGSHIGHHDEWVDQIATRTSSLEGRVPTSEAWRLRRVAMTSQRVDAIFAGAVVPAVSEEGGRRRPLRAQARIHSLSEQMASDADALVGALERRMVEAQASADRAFRWALGVTLLGLLAALALSWFQLGRLRRSILLPLGVLAEQARKGAPRAIQRSDVAAEITSLAGDLDRMRGRLSEREDALVRHERAVVIGRVSAGVAEEIDRPLSSIRDRLRALARGIAAVTWAEELAVLDEEVGCCRRIVEDLGASAGGPQITAQPVRTHELVREAMQHYLRGHPDTPSPIVDVEDATVSGDSVWLRQVLVNLMENAARAATSRFEVRGARSGSRFVFEVADRGPGIAPENRDRVFEPFFSHRPGGTWTRPGGELCRGSESRRAAPHRGESGRRRGLEVRCPALDRSQLRGGQSPRRRKSAALRPYRRRSR